MIFIHLVLLSKGLDVMSCNSETSTPFHCEFIWVTFKTSCISLERFFKIQHCISHVTIRLDFLIFVLYFTKL